MKRAVCFLMSAILGIGSLAGCAKDTAPASEKEVLETAGAANSGTDARPSETEAKVTADLLGKYDEPVKVTMVNQLSDDMSKQLETIGESVDDNRWIKRYKERLNIDLEYMWVAKPEAYKEKMNLMMASGELPDIMKVDAVQFR